MSAEEKKTSSEAPSEKSPADAPKASAKATAAAESDGAARRRGDAGLGTGGAGRSATPSASGTEEEREGGLWPAILVGVGLLAVVALLVFTGGSGDKKPEKAKASAQGASAPDEPTPAGGGARGGVEPRPYDKAAPGSPQNPKLNPAIPLPQMGMAPEGGTPQAEDKPPENATKEELIAYYERKLEEAQRHLVQRKIFKDRLPGIRQRIEESDRPDKERELQAFETRAKTVNDNLDRAQQKVDDLEKKLSDLRE